MANSRLLQRRSSATLTLWHGGNLDDPYDESMSHRKGRFEYGPGLYLTTHYTTAQRYAKGSRKLYRITVAQGNDAHSTNLNWDEAVGFIKTTVIKSKQKEILERLERHKEAGLKAVYFINLLVNLDALPASRSGLLRKFLVDSGVDYDVVRNAFGWGETMLVLFNMKKILKKEVITPKTKIEVFDLPTEFAEA